ncbi:MAG: hypothetical protein JWQ38_185 [Flavipsychrobacter sp.]|nr:hypothetical protein [Flavipsychrobacter sp.]
MAQEFVEHIMKDERFYVLTLVEGYNPDAPKDDLKLLIDANYETTRKYVGKYKLTSIENWYKTYDTLFAKNSDYAVYHENVIIPFDLKATGKEPAMLMIGFNSGYKDKIFDFIVIEAENILPDGNVKVNRRSSRDQEIELNR